MNQLNSASGRVMRDEIDILYAASNRLTQASTAVEQLEAVSSYPREQGAKAGMLFYIDPDSYGRPDYLEVVAEWVTATGLPAGIGTRYNFRDMSFTQVWTATPNRPTLISDTMKSDLVDTQTREFYKGFNVHALAVLPLNIKGRWVGVMVFTWNTPYIFDERDQRILTAITQQAGPVVDSVRLFEQTQRRAEDLENAKREIDILYAASNKLTRASTPVELLDALSDYALDNGATSAMLFYLYTNSRGSIDGSEIVAEWALEEGMAVGIGRRYDYKTGRSAIQALLESPDYPVFIEDASVSPFLDETSRMLYEQHHVRATALLPLSSKGRWVGIVMFSWNRPHQFDERDERIFTAMIQQTAPIVDSIRLLEQTRRRAARTERLLEVNTALSQATNEEQILAAVALYAERQGAAFLSLSYIDVDETGRPVELSTVARHKDGKPWPSPVAVYRMMDLPATAMWIDEPENIVYFEDIGSDPRLDDKSRWTLTRFGDYQSTLSMPLYSAGRWSGVIVMSWLEPHDFSEDERHILGALRQTAISVVATRRAYLAEEEAREESELLYRASEAINAANSFEEIIEAVKLIDTNSDSLVLVNFEGYDFDNAGWLEVVATSKDSTWQMGARYPFDLFPVLYEIPRHGIITFEDINTDEGIDPITRASILENNYHATISVSLSLNRRWMGMILSQSHKPRVYTPRQRRLFAGIGDLAAAAVERIRLRAESEQARLRAETLAQINAALSQSTNEEEILAAVSLLAERYHVNLSMLSYLDTGERNELLAVNAMALRSGHGDVLPLSILPIISFGPEDYPVLQNAYSHPHELLFIENLFTDPRSETGDTREFSKAVRWSAVILMPLKTGDQWLGMLQFAWEKPQQFTPEMRSVFNEIRPTTLSVVATRRAYLAVEKARRETEQRVHELETVAKVSAAVTTILDLDLLLDTVCELTETSFKLDQVNIYLLESDGENLILAESAEAPFDGSYAHAQSRLIGLQDETSLVAQAGYLRHGIIVGGPSPETGPLQTMSPAALSELAVPMVVGDKLIGVLDVQSREANRFTEADARVMTTLADLVAVAVQNARLYQQAQTLATSEERHRLARELHDSVSQALYGIALGARTARTMLDRDPSRVAEPLDYVLSLAEAGLAEMRALIFELRPESLENEGLIGALGKQAASMQVRHGIKVTTNFCGEPPLNPDLKEALYRIAREALHNTVKHARATEVGLCVEYNDSNVLLEVSDNGVGFDTHGSFPGHLGLTSMRERTTRLRGDIEIESVSGGGTCIRVSIPLS